MLTKNIQTTVAIIGAGPSGAVSAALLRKKGYDVTILERQTVPRFSIGESLLPQCMEFLEKADMLDVIANEPTFQHKNGAAFSNNRLDATIDFREKFSAGHGTTYQVRRDKFDKILADKAESLGANIHYQTSVVAIDEQDDFIEITAKNNITNDTYTVKADFLLDASGFGRVLPRLLDLETPSDFPVRQAFFGHFEDNITEPSFDRDKILISVHPEKPDVWYWLIPFADGVSSVGVVAKEERFEEHNGDNAQTLQMLIDEMPYLAKVLENAKPINEAQNIKGYSANVKKLHGKRYALLGNAAEFLDPVFSSGVTIAVKSADLAVNALDKQLQGKNVDWDAEFAEPLKKGVDTFRTFVTAWYDGRLQDVIFYQNSQPKIKSMISSILAGYAWDEENPFVANSEKRLNTLAELCKN